MIVQFLRILLWQLLVITIAAIEQTVALPFITLTLMAILFVNSTSFVFFSLVLLASLLLASLFSVNWVIVWFILVAYLLLFRSPLISTKTPAIVKLLVIVVFSLALGFIRQPQITQSMMIHSFVGLVISWYLLYKFSLPQQRGLDVSKLRFSLGSDEKS